RVVNNPSLSEAFRNHTAMLCSLAGIENFSLVDSKPAGHLVALLGTTEICIDLAGVIDVEAELARVENELGKVEKEMAKISVKLENADFVSKAPAEVVEKIREGIEAYKQQIAKLQQYQKDLRSI
ncbi:MAG: valine--tRNA ligase, partial [Candidatus Riflebacteria bacterium]|nr:valine--tRNA ligase [Candidatus Riflebacteria bacterium]